MQSYMEFGKIQDKADVLKTIIETIDGRPVAKNTKIIVMIEINTIYSGTIKIGTFFM